MKNRQTIKRTDRKGRILHTGESQRKDGRYVFKYQDKNGSPQFLYSWKLEEHDRLPAGKRPCEALRSKEAAVLRDEMDGIDTSGSKMTVCQLYAKQNRLKPNVKKQTAANRENLMAILEADMLGHMAVGSVKPSHAKAWAIRMKGNYSYQTIQNAKRSLKACFYTAIGDDLIRKNPFDWKLADVIPDDTRPKAALTPGQEKALLEFVKADSTYQKHYNAITILLNTGLRVSELCGLTVKDIDFKNGFIHVNHQLVKDKDGYYIDTPKTESSIRQIPMSGAARTALARQVETLGSTPAAAEVDGCSGFLFLQEKGTPMYGRRYSTIFIAIIKKYNKCHKGSELPDVTPHTCRHTFCTNMANKGMTPKVLQYIMGHKNVTMTLGYYAHGSSESAKEEMDRLAV